MTKLSKSPMPVVRFNIHTMTTSKRRRSFLSLLLGFSFLNIVAHAAITDTQVNALVSDAIQTHPLVQSARAEQQATLEGIDAAKLNLLPTPSISAGYDADNDFVTQVNLRQPLWTGGQLTANVNQAIFDDKAAIEYVYQQQNEVAKTTIEAWQSYVDAVGKQRVYADMLDTLAEFEAMMTRRVRAGVSARIELDLVANRILQEQNAYQAAVEQERIALARLEQIIGRSLPANNALPVPDLKLLMAEAKAESQNFEQMAFNQISFYNPAVVREAYLVESAKQQLKAEDAVKYPNVYAQYQHSFYEDSDDNDGQFSIGAEYAPGAGFSNFALARASEARVNSLIQSQEATRRTVMEGIQTQYQRLISARDRELSLVAASAGSQIVLSSYRRQFIAGRKQWLDVLNAVRELSDYEVQLVQTRAEYLAAFYKLQVDFGLMSWQQRFAQNREPVTLFRASDPVKAWLDEQGYATQTDLTRPSVPTATQAQLGYGTPNQSQNSSTTVLAKSADDQYVSINVPEDAAAELDNGSVILLEDDSVVIEPTNEPSLSDSE